MDPFLNPTANFERLYEEYKKYGSLFIGYDFDDTVHDFHKRGSTFPKVIQLLRDLKRQGNKLMCWTAYPDHTYVMEYLKKHEIPCDGINQDGVQLWWTSRKPIYSALLDDRAGLYSAYYDLARLVKTIDDEKNGKL